MPSFAGLYSPQLRLRLALGAIALVAIAVSLLLAFASVTVPRANIHARETSAEIPIAAPPAQRPEVSTGAASGTIEHDRPPSLWTLLVPWALAVDAIAVLGFVAAARMWRR